MEASSMSLPNIEYGRSQPDNRDLNVSRMSAGFADVSQLADEEKEKLDMLIDRLEEERRRMMATTELLEASHSGKNHSGRPEEQENLQHELEDIKHYNYELERELTELQASIHPGIPVHSSTPQTRFVPRNSSSSQQFVPQEQYNHNDTQQQYYTPDSTHPKRSFETTPSQYMTTHSEFISPKLNNGSQLQYSHPNGHNGKDPKIYPANVAPHYEPLKSPNPSYSSKRSSPKITHTRRGLSPKSSRVPMKVPRAAYRSLDTSPTPREPETPLEFSKRSFRSLGNSPRTPENSPLLKSGPWGSLKVLPDSPQPKLSKQRRRSSSHTSHGSQGSLHKSEVNQRNLELSQGGRSPKNFNVGASMNMYESEKLEYSNESISFSDASEKSLKHHKAKIRSPKAAQRNAHYSKSETSDRSMNFDSQTTVDSPNRSSTPKPKQRRVRSNTHEKSFEDLQQKSDISDSISEASLKVNKKRSKNTPIPREESQNRQKSNEKHRNKPSGSSSTHKSDSRRHSRTKPRSSASSVASPNSRPRTASVDRNKISKNGQRKISRDDTRGSLVAPRHVNSCDNLAYQGSLDSLDTLHGGVSNHSLGVYGTSDTETISPIPDSPRSFDPRRTYTEEIEPYANIHSSENYLTESHTDLEQANITKQRKPKSKSGKQSPDVHVDTQSSVASKSSHKRTRSNSKHLQSPTITTSSSSLSNAGSRNSIKDRLQKKKLMAKQSSDGESDHSRTSPEGDMAITSSEHSIEPRFETPEEEMKYLVNKLQGIMHSIHDQPLDKSISIEVKSRNPMNEVLLAAQQTRQSIRLFTEYAIAVAAGEI